MSELIWDKVSERYYETGIDRCVLYVKDGASYLDGVAWNGVTALTEAPSGGEPTAIYADDKKYLVLFSKEDFRATIEAYTFPDEFRECDGSVQVAEGESISLQNRKSFGLCYRTKVGNDTDGADHAYKLHLIYNCRASPSEEANQTINDSPEPVNFSWEITTVPVKLENYSETSHVVIDSRKVSANALAELEALVYGTADNPPTFPSPDIVKRIIDFDGSYLYSYTDPKDDGNVIIVPRNPRIQMYQYSDEDSDGNVVISLVGERLYSYDDPEDNGEVVIEEVDA